VSLERLYAGAEKRKWDQDKIIELMLLRRKSKEILEKRY
jgi:hypothetical protein